MVLAGVRFVESLTLALSTWGSIIGIAGSAAGFIALLCGRSYRDVERAFIYASSAATPTGFLVAISTLMLESL